MVRKSFAVSSSERFLFALLLLDDDDGLESHFPVLVFCSEGDFLSEEAPEVVWEEEEREESRAPEGAAEDDDDEDEHDDTDDGGEGDGLRLRDLRRLPLRRDDDDDSNFGLRLRFRPPPPLNIAGDFDEPRFGDIGGLCGGEFGGKSGGLDERPSRREGGGDAAWVLRLIFASSIRVSLELLEGDGERMCLRLGDCNGESGGELERRGDGERERSGGDETRVSEDVMDDFGECGGDGEDELEDFVSPKSSFVFVGVDCVSESATFLAPDACRAFLKALCTEGEEVGDGGMLARERDRADTAPVLELEVDLEPADDMLNEIPPLFGFRLLKLNEIPPAPFEDFLLGDSGGERVDAVCLRFFLFANVSKPSGSSSDSNSESLFGRSLKSSSSISGPISIIVASSSSSSSCQ